MSQSIEKLLADAGLTQKVLSDLREAGEILIPEIDEILENFYTEVRASPELTGFFVDEASMSRARNGQRKHWIQMLKADLDEAYLATTERVGLAHARIGLPMETYLRAGSKVSAQMQTRLMSKCRHMISGDEYERFSDMFQAVTRVFQLDAELVTRAFFNELDKDKKKAFDLLAGGLSRLAAGDFSQPIGAPEVSGFPKEYDTLREHYDSSLDQLGHTVASISSVVEYLSMHAGEIARSTTDLSRRTENQAATLEETTTSLQLITSSVNSTAEGTQKADKAMNAASEGAERGGKVVLEATDAMNEIVSSSREISRKIRVIDDIAFQTNLLALNAGVEAARAGDAGRGFAVVASEVRALAVRSAEAAKEIGQLIEDSSRHVEHGVSRVGEVGKALQKIVTDVATVEALVSEISESSRTQATSLSEINMAASQLDQVTQQNAAMAEETTAASQGVHQNAERLAEIVGGFQLASEHVSQPGAGDSELRRAS